jgi:hypothetical protein
MGYGNIHKKCEERAEAARGEWESPKFEEADEERRKLSDPYI